MKFLLVLAVSLLVVVAAGVGILLFRTPAVSHRIEGLSREVQQLRAELESRKSGTLTDPERAAILQLIVDDRAAQHSKQLEEQHDRLLELSRASADRAAKKYGLTPDQRTGFVDVLLLSQDKLKEMEEQLRDLGLKSDIDGMVKASNAAWNDFKAWRTQELTKRLGAELARRVEEDDDFDALTSASLGQASQQSR